ncbi:hypothetical protein J4476_00075 [Candidatus Woesearchaeota archaeon]|nr:hypothetical protein [Candidatus Woesearchaeota archaeon]HIH25488.1 hypothetical protein [Nanoarchaeota archaeon]
MINISVWLYGKPAWDLNIEGSGDIDSAMLRERADELCNHLHVVADLVDKLVSNGWYCHGTLYSLEFSKDNIRVKEDAVKELNNLGIDPDNIDLEEYEDICDEEDEDLEED